MTYGTQLNQKSTLKGREVIAGLRVLLLLDLLLYLDVKTTESRLDLL